MMANNNKMSVLVWMMTVLLLLAACSQNGTNHKSSDSGSSVESRSNNDGVSAKKSTNNESEQSKEVVRKVIYKGEITLTVEDLPKARKQVEILASRLGGYIVESETYTEEESNEGGYVSIRVPQEQFRKFMDQAGKLGKGVPRETTRGKDVTEEYTDLEARLKAKNLVRERLESFMKKSEKTDDLLAISKELSNVQEKIEQLQGRIRYLENQSDLSTVMVSFEVKNFEADSIQGKDLNTWKKSKKLFVDTWDGVVRTISYVIVGIIGLLPVILPLAAITAFIYYRKKKRKKETKL